MASSASASSPSAARRIRLQLVVAKRDTRALLVSVRRLWGCGAGGVKEAAGSARLRIDPGRESLYSPGKSGHPRRRARPWAAASPVAAPGGGKHGSMSERSEGDERTPASPPRWRLFGWLLGETEPQAPPLPTRIGRYRVLDQIGEGGMGRVLLASDDTLRRNVALKTLKRRDRSSRRRFLREARAAARISHPNVCPIFEVGEEGGWPFLAMELLPGETLAARLRRERAVARRGAGRRRGPAGRPGRPARRGRRAPGPQALEHLPDAPRRQAPRLRPGPRAAERRRPRSRDGHRHHATGPHHRDPGLHGPGADPRPPRGRARRPLRRRGRPLRGPDRAAAVPGRQRHPGALRHALRGASPPRRRPGARGAGRADPPGHGQEAGRAPRLGTGDGRRPAGGGEGGRGRRARGGARDVRRPAGRARLPGGAIRGGRGGGGQRRLRDRRARGREEHPRRRVPAPGAGGGDPGDAGGRPMPRGGRPGRGLPALLRRARPPAHEPRPRPGLGAPAHLRAHHLRADAGRARARPRRLAPPPGGGSDEGASHPRGRRLHEGGGPRVPDRLPPRGPAVGGRGQRGHAPSPGLPPRPAAHAHRGDVPAGRRGRGSTPR